MVLEYKALTEGTKHGCMKYPRAWDPCPWSPRYFKVACTQGVAHIPKVTKLQNPIMSLKNVNISHVLLTGRFPDSGIAPQVGKLNFL